MRISDWSSDVCSSDLSLGAHLAPAFNTLFPGVTNQVTAFNTPGFTNTTTNQQFFGMLGGSVPTTANSDNVTNVIADERSEERRVGKESVSPCRSRWSPTN